MKNLSGALRVEYHRIFDWKNILLTVVLTELILLAATLSYCRTYSYLDFNMYAMFNEIFKGVFMSMTELIIIPVSAFATCALYTDLRERWSYFMVSRTDLKAYIFAKMVIGVLYAGCLIFIAVCLYEGFLYVFTKGDIGNLADSLDDYADLLEDNIVLYFIQRNILIAILAMFTTALGMSVTVIIMNRYISYIAAFIAFIILDDIMVVTDGIFKPVKLLYGMVRFPGGIAETLLLLLLMIIVTAVICGNIVYFFAKWRYFDGKN